MSNKKKEKTEQQTETITEQEEIVEENIAKIESLIEELDKIEHSGDPNIRICPRCFSVRVKVVDILTSMGINSGYPVCRCLDCGWQSKKWIYLDLTLGKEERETFYKEILEEKSKT
ncbi:MAG: hypothetical protein FK730_03495 [Asgard group archaeon]|nr:hypothetical protein [Asgard group archaeon]